MYFLESVLLLDKTLLTSRYHLHCPFTPYCFEVSEQVQPLLEWYGCRSYIKIKALFSFYIFELLPGKNAFESSAWRWLPGSENMHYKVSETLPICTMYQGWSSFAQTQHHHINSR